MLKGFGTIWHNMARFLGFCPIYSRIYSGLPVLPKISNGSKEGRGEHLVLSAEDAEGRGELPMTSVHRDSEGAPGDEGLEGRVEGFYER